MYKRYKKNNTDIIVKAEQITENQKIDEEIIGLNPRPKDWIVVENGDKYVVSDLFFRENFTKEGKQLLFD